METFFFLVPGFEYFVTWYVRLVLTPDRDFFFFLYLDLSNLLTGMWDLYCIVPLENVCLLQTSDLSHFLIVNGD